MSKAVIIIERPDGQIPGLLEVNAILTERFGVTVAAVIDDSDGRLMWIGTELRHSHIDNDTIIVGKKYE